MGVEEKQLVLSSIFPEKIQFDGKKCRTLKMNQAFLLLLSIDKGSRGQEKRDKLKNLGLSLGVEKIDILSNSFYADLVHLSYLSNRIWSKNIL
jgi:hypothetical protein